MNETQTPINQTKFSFEEPIFEDQAVYSEDTPALKPEKKPRNKKKITLLVGAAILLLLILLIIAAKSMKKNTGYTPVEETTSEAVEELGPLQKRIDDARDLLNEADPAKQDLAFPPVDLQLRLDTKEK